MELEAGEAVHDDYLEELIEAAVEQVEKDTPIVTRQRTFELILNGFPNANTIEFPVRPVSEVASVTYRDGEADPVELDSDLYRLDRRGRSLILNHGGQWPEIPEQPEAVVIDFTAGFESATEVPRLVKRAIALQIGKWFEDREMFVTKTSEQFDQAYERIIRRLMRSTYP